MTAHQLFIAAPAAGSLSATVARALAQGRQALARAGYGAPVLGPHPGGQVHIDDTLLGRPVAGLQGFFVGAGHRADAFADRLDQPIERLVLATMPYDLYFPMLWRHLAQRRLMTPFAQMAPALEATVQGPDARGWVQIVAELRAVFAPREMIVLPHPVEAADVLDALVPDAALVPPPALAAEVPDTGIAMLQRLFAQNVTIAPRQIARLMAFHQRQPQPAPIAAFGPLEAARLRKAYAADLAQIAAMPGVRLGAAPSLCFAAE